MFFIYLFLLQNATRKVKQQEQLLALLNSRLEFLNSDLPLVKKSPLESGAFNEVQGLQSEFLLSHFYGRYYAFASVTQLDIFFAKLLLLTTIWVSITG